MRVGESKGQRQNATSKDEGCQFKKFREIDVRIQKKKFLFNKNKATVKVLVLNGKQSMKPQAVCVCAVLQKTQKALPSTANPSLRSERSERPSKKVQ